MALPFILGLVVGGSAVVAYNKRKEIGAFFQKEQNLTDIQKVFEKGKELFVRNKETEVQEAKPDVNQTEATQAKASPETNMQEGKKEEVKHAH